VAETATDAQAEFSLIGPPGAWRLTEFSGVRNPSAVQGSFPDRLVFDREPGSEVVFLAFEYLGVDAVTSVFGENVPAGRPFRFEFLEKRE
jgi:hypothetical protein